MDALGSCNAQRVLQDAYLLLEVGEELRPAPMHLHNHVTDARGTGNRERGTGERGREGMKERRRWIGGGTEGQETEGERERRGEANREGGGGCKRDRWGRG